MTQLVAIFVGLLPLVILFISFVVFVILLLLVLPFVVFFIPFRVAQEWTLALELLWDVSDPARDGRGGATYAKESRIEGEAICHSCSVDSRLAEAF